MTNNYINVSVTSRQNQKVSVSTPPPSAEVTATTDTGKFWALIAERWATSNAIVENKDYSSKYYANQSKLSATNAKTYESAVKNTYNTFLEVSSDAIAEIQSTKEETLTQIETSRVETVNNINTVKNTAVDDINASKTNIIQDIEFVADGEKEEIQELAEKAKDDIESTGFYMRDDKLYFINSEGQEEEFKSGGGGLEIGDIGFTQMTIDETKGKRRILNGQLIIQDQYVQFTNIIKNSVALNPDLACTETEWQTEVTMNTFGLCGKFVIDDEGGTIRLPKYPNYFIAGLANIATVAGNGKALGMTDGTSDFGMIHYTTSAVGATLSSKGYTVQNAGATTSDGVGSSGANAKFIGVTTDPTKSGIEAQINEKQIAGTYFIQVATGSETEDNIINEIELNNPFFYGMSEYFESQPNNLSWLKSEGQWNSKAVYTDYYDWLLKIYNDAEIVDGVSVKLSTETYTDYDFVLNISNETFRLPLLNGNENHDYEDDVDFATPASGTVLTAEYNGIYSASGNGGTNTFVMFNYDGTNISTDCFTASTLNARIFIPVKKGQKVKFQYNTTSTRLSFAKSKGNGSLYFYVGETVQNANLINAGRIEEKLVDKLDRGNKEEIISWAMPDYTAGINITSLPYTAPKDGLISIIGRIGNSMVVLKLNDTPMIVVDSTATGNFVRDIRVKKGDILDKLRVTGTVPYNDSSRNEYSMFYPLKGAN